MPESTLMPAPRGFGTVVAVYLLATLLVCGASPALARGPGTGGGGGVILCLNADQSVKKVELVDLVESQFYDKTELSPALASLPWEEQVKAAMNRIAFADPQFHSMLWERVQIVKREHEHSMDETRDKDVIFPAPQDLSHGRVPPLRLGCQVAGAAVFNDEAPAGSRLKISHFLWKELSPMHQAALVMHEAVYLTHRDIYRNRSREDAPDSSSTRALVGFLFSKDLELGSQPAAERERFRTAPQYQGYPLLSGSVDPRAGFREKVSVLFRPLSPFFAKGMERPLFLGERDCHGKPFQIRVIDQDPFGEKNPNRCELKTVVFRGIGNSEGKILRPAESNSARASYAYLPNPGNLLEDVRLSCRTESSLRHHNPGFRLFCGARLIADIPGSEERDTVGISIKSKKDFERTFLQDFDFEP